MASSDYSEDLRIGPEILKTTVDSYRKLRNTMRWMLGTLAHDRGTEVPWPQMPELERLMLHRLAELDVIVREGYDAFDFKRVLSSLSNFMVVELSAFYFDIRKDALYCDAPSSAKRLAALQTVRVLFDCLAKWLAPMLPFTMEEAWLDRNPGEGVSVHLEQFPDVPAEWRNDALAEKWAKDSPRAPRRHRRAGNRTQGKAHRFVARSRPGSLRGGRGTARRARRARFRRNLHHKPDHGEQRRPAPPMHGGWKAKPPLPSCRAAPRDANARVRGASFPKSAPIRNFRTCRCAMPRRFAKSNPAGADGVAGFPPPVARDGPAQPVTALSQARFCVSFPQLFGVKAGLWPHLPSSD